MCKAILRNFPKDDFNPADRTTYVEKIISNDPKSYEVHLNQRSAKRLSLRCAWALPLSAKEQSGPIFVMILKSFSNLMLQFSPYETSGIDLNVVPPLLSIVIYVCGHTLTDFGMDNTWDTIDLYAQQKWNL